jgi:hypothetical protein
MIGEENVMKLETEERATHYSHHFVSLHIMHVQYIQVVKTVIERVTYLQPDINHRIEETDLLKLNHSH